MQKCDDHIRVWDPLIRLFHWGMAAAFAVAWWAQGRDLRIHILAGVVLAGLLLFRLIWGVVGNDHARFRLFIPTRQMLAAHLRGLLRLQSQHYIGHTPIGSVMIYILLIALIVLVCSGMLLIGLQLGLGPFAAWALNVAFSTEMQVTQLHAWCYQLLLVLIAIHLAGVVVESLIQRTNLVRAMITGNKRWRHR